MLLTISNALVHYRCVDKIYNISVKTVMRFELFVRWNSKARIPIDGEASRFCDTDTEILCLRFYCDVVVLHFKSHCVYNRRGSNLFLMIFP